MKNRTKTEPIFEQIAEFKQSKADIRRMVILNAVIDCLAEDGLHNLTSLNISRRTKMLRSHINYYFPNQEKMIGAAIQFVITTGQEITVAHLAVANHPEERLLAHTKATFAWFERFPKHASVMLMLHYYGAVSPTYRKLNQQIFLAGVSRLEAILASGKLKKGTSKRQITDVAKKIRSFLVGALTHAIFMEPPIHYDDEYRSASKTVQNLAQEIWA